MLYKMNRFSCLLMLLALMGAGLCTQGARADTPLSYPDVRGEYVGQSATDWAVVFFINTQSPYVWHWTWMGTGELLAHFNGSVSLNFGPDIPMSGTIRSDGAMEFGYSYWDDWGGCQTGNYTARLMQMDDGAKFETTNGSFITTIRYFRGQDYGWNIYPLASGWFYDFQF